MLDQDNNFNLISLSILIACLLNIVWIFFREKLYINHFWELKDYCKTNTYYLGIFTWYKATQTC